MAVLITGLGYLGIPLAAELLRRGERVVGIENFFSTSPEQVEHLVNLPDFRLVRADVASVSAMRRVFAEERVQTIFHLAAQASAHPRAARASYTERTNLVGPRVLLEAIPEGARPTLVYGSSFRVYGDELRGRVTESAPYGRMADLSHLSKIYAEKLLELHAHHRQLPAVALRLGVVYGLGPAMKLDLRFLTVPNLFCLRATRGEQLHVHPGANRPIGFIHLRDAVAALAVSPSLAAPGFNPINAVTEVLSVPRVAELVAQQAAERGLQVAVSGADSSEGELFEVESALDGLDIARGERMERSLGEVLDYYGAHREGQAGAATGGRAV